MAGISTLGIGSGLDLNAILQKLTSAEKQSLDPISRQQSSATSKLSAYGSLKAALQAFQAANNKLKDAGLYTATKATSSSAAFSAETDGKAVAGKYSISVQSLARSQTLTSRTETDIAKGIGSSDPTRTLTFVTADGKEKSISLTKDQTSLSAMRDAINKSDAGISASLIKVSATEYRLSLNSTATGTSNALKSVTVTGDDALQKFIGFNASGKPSGGLTESVKAQNAMLTVNNVAIESSSNTISNAVEGITLKLSDQTTGVQTLTVDSDTSKPKGAITEWVNAYNSLQDTIAGLTKYTAVNAGTAQDGKNGALLGDGTVRIIQTQLKDILTSASGSSIYKSLSQVGVSSDPSNGKLIIDADKLNSAIQVKPADVRDMFTGDGKKSGITTTLDTKLSDFLSNRGAIQGATDSISKKLNSLTDQYNSASKRIDDTIARYKMQFTNLDKMLSMFNSTSSYLTEQFSNNSGSK